MPTGDGRLMHYTPGDKATIGQYVFYVPGVLTTGTNVSVEMTPPITVQAIGWRANVKTAVTGGGIKLDVKKDDVSIFTGALSGLYPVIQSSVEMLTGTLSSPVSVSSEAKLTVDILSGNSTGAGLSFALRTVPI